MLFRFRIKRGPDGEMLRNHDNYPIQEPTMVVDASLSVLDFKDSEQFTPAGRLTLRQELPKGQESTFWLGQMFEMDIREIRVAQS